MYYEHMFILLKEESLEEMRMRSAGRAVGGERKLFIWNEIVSPAGRSVRNMLLTVTLFWFCTPLHCIVFFTFYL